MSVILIAYHFNITYQFNITRRYQSVILLLPDQRMLTTIDVTGLQRDAVQQRLRLEVAVDDNRENSVRYEMNGACWIGSLSRFDAKPIH
ncbi:hypothetical protein C5B90_12110 [Haloferax sp. Atlit-12N]|nr:hypothetical protein C5B90_12110 [Haloferax sp. Atlit-12N]